MGADAAGHKGRSPATAATAPDPGARESRGTVAEHPGSQGSKPPDVPSTPRTMRPSLSRLALVPLLALAAACAGGAVDASEAEAETEPTQEAAAPASSGTVQILEPADGAEVDGPDVTVRLQAADVEIVPAGELMDGTGHHHLFVDTDVSAAGTPIPTVPGEVIHMGDGSAEYVLEGLEAGEHRLIAVVADGLHVPLQPWVVDTVTFTVR